LMQAKPFLLVEHGIPLRLSIRGITHRKNSPLVSTWYGRPLCFISPLATVITILLSSQIIATSFSLSIQATFFLAVRGLLFPGSVFLYILENSKGSLPCFPAGLVGSG
jgi:hypothetical protein